MFENKQFRFKCSFTIRSNEVSSWGFSKFSYIGIVQFSRINECACEWSVQGFRLSKYWLKSKRTTAICGLLLKISRRRSTTILQNYKKMGETLIFFGNRVLYYKITVYTVKIRLRVELKIFMNEIRFPLSFQFFTPCLTSITSKFTRKPAVSNASSESQ